MIMWVTLGLFGLLARFRVAFVVSLIIICSMEHWLAQARPEMDQSGVLPARHHQRGVSGGDHGGSGVPWFGSGTRISFSRGQLVRPA
jgi:hypothetical protein